MCILARSLPYLPADKLLDLSAGRGVVFTGLWVCKVLVVGIWVVPEGGLEYGLVSAIYSGLPVLGSKRRLLFDPASHYFLEVEGAASGHWKYEGA